MVISLRDIIREVTREHLDNGNILAGQCLSAVGFVANTVPNHKNLLELPTSDVSNGGVMVGISLFSRPIYVIRYQGFWTYNGSSIINYAAKSKELWKTPCPLFVRAIGMEGKIGPVATGMHHSIAMHYPGLPVWAPCTPDEWKECFQYFLDHDDPMFCSENRLTYDVIEPIKSVYKEHETCLIGIGPSRLYIKNTEYNQVHIYKLKPFNLTDEDLDIIKRSKRCIIIDSDFTTCGASEHIALKIWQLGIPAYVLGLKDKTAGFSRDNLTPTLEEIKSYENDLLRY